MAAPFAFPVTAAQVGTFFVGQYYQVLQQQPELVHQFYSDSSTVLRVDGNTRETATAMLQIHTLIMSLRFTGIEIKTAHSLESWNGGILTIVSGSLQIKDLNGRRKFNETFFLAPQENGYFVLNDIFSFVDEERTYQHPEVLLAQKNLDSRHDASAKLPEPVSKYVVAEDTQARELLAPLEVKDTGRINAYSFSEQQVLQSNEPEINAENKSTEEANGSLQTTMGRPTDELQTASVEETVGEPQRHTYASILQVSKGHSAPAVAPQPRANQNGNYATDRNHASPSADQQPVVSSNGAESSQVDSVERVSASENEGEIKSVFIRNLLPTVSISEIEEEFKKFGEIKPNGVAIRSRKDVGVCYAFVQFEDLSSVYNAIKAGSVQIGGRQIYIEERRPNGNMSFRGARGRGRGNDPRGRFVSRGGHNGSDQSYNRRKPNGFYRPVARQDKVSEQNSSE